VKKFFLFALTMIVGLSLCVATTGCPSKDTKKSEEPKKESGK